MVIVLKFQTLVAWEWPQGHNTVTLPGVKLESATPRSLFCGISSGSTVFVNHATITVFQSRKDEKFWIEPSLNSLPTAYWVILHAHGLSPHTVDKPWYKYQGTKIFQYSTCPGGRVKILEDERLTMSLVLQTHVLVL